MKRDFFSFFSDVVGEYCFLDCYKEIIGYTRISNLFTFYCINMHDFIPKIHRHGVSVSDKDYDDVINDSISENMFFVYNFHDHNLTFTMKINEFVNEYMYEYIYEMRNKKNNI